MKDPAFLLYTSDFLTGTLFMSNEQVGKYIRLLCLQHQQGHLTESQMLHICGPYDELIFSKFAKDDKGLFFNERCEFEINKRKAYSISRSKNRKGKEDMKNICSTYVQHMENENENENIIENKDEKRKTKKEKTKLELTFDSYLEMRKKIKKPPTEHAIKLLKEDLEKLSKGNEQTKILILEQSIKNSWQGLFELKKTEADKQATHTPTRAINKLN